VYEVSAASREGLRELTFAMARLVAAARAARPVEEATRIVLRPTAVDEVGFTLEVDPDVDGGFVVRGAKPERWILQTDFNNEEAVGYLADRLNRLGVEKALVGAGAEPGAPVTIGDVTFDWRPAEMEDFVSGARGVDPRLAPSARTRATERRFAKDLRRAERLGLDVEEVGAE
jgi:GTP-binding protein